MYNVHCSLHTVHCSHSTTSIGGGRWDTDTCNYSVFHSVNYNSVGGILITIIGKETLLVVLKGQCHEIF